jgi:hypothetical protein
LNVPEEREVPVPNRTLEEAGFYRVGHVSISRPSEFTVKYDFMPEAEWWVCSLYAFRIKGKVVRIGKTEGVLRQRIAAWQRDVTRALNGKRRKGGTTPQEAADWKRLLPAGRHGDFLAMPILSPNVDVLRSKERQLVEEYGPPLNHELTKKVRISK